MFRAPSPRSPGILLPFFRLPGRSDALPALTQSHRHLLHCDDLKAALTYARGLPTVLTKIATTEGRRKTLKKKQADPAGLFLLVAICLIGSCGVHEEKTATPGRANDCELGSNPFDIITTFLAVVGGPDPDPRSAFAMGKPTQPEFDYTFKVSDPQRGACRFRYDVWDERLNRARENEFLWQNFPSDLLLNRYSVGGCGIILGCDD